jgi:Ribosomal protein L4/L1 family
MSRSSSSRLPKDGGPLRRRQEEKCLARTESPGGRKEPDGPGRGASAARCGGKAEIPKQAKKNALKSALALRFSEKRLVVLTEANLKEPKTKEAAKLLQTLNLDSALIVDQSDNRNLFVAIRNIPNVKAIDSKLLSAVDVLKHRWLVLTQRALESVLERI